MPLFSYKKNRVVPLVPPPAAPLRQNVYSAYNHIAHSPPPPPFIEDNGRSYSKNIRRQFKEHEDIEKYNHQKLLLAEAQKIRRKISYSRVFCCFCFPCLPMWTRTICCFLFLGLCGIIGLITFSIMTFKRPQIVFNGYSSQQERYEAGSFRLEYSVYNGNYFEFDFDSIKAVIYYPTPNKTTIGVGEIYELMLGPQTVTNITFPVQIMTNNGFNEDIKTIDIESKTNISENTSEEAFKKIITSSCTGKNSSNQKEIAVIFDLMPTIKIYGYPIITLAFIGQSTKMSCEKLDSFMREN